MRIEYAIESKITKSNYYGDRICLEFEIFERSIDEFEYHTDTLITSFYEYVEIPNWLTRKLFNATIEKRAKKRYLKLLRRAKSYIREHEAEREMLDRCEKAIRE